ncbi:MAG: PAS domain S-box protein [Desulfarculaceae bacterium]|nr:PAS domain S-box protein [Desulfarculaceae bacterium]
MFESLTVITVFCLYMGLIFALAVWAERRQAAGKSVVNNPLVYALSLSVYCTTWTYYGSVGYAANSGLLFLTIYLGPTMVVMFWWGLLRKLVRIKTTHHITSIADFIGARYEKSVPLAGLATIIALVGTMPYIALQLKAVLTTFDMITQDTGMASAFIGSHVGPIVLVLMVVFTIIFGVRRLDPTERHEGIVMAVAAEGLVKLVLFMAAGVFVVYVLYDGFGDIFARYARLSENLPGLAVGSRTTNFLTWTSYLVLSASAVMFLPRQFHIAVVENQNEEHIKKAMWLFPLYMFLINLFVYPIALAGLLDGLPLASADTYVLQLPLKSGNHLLTLLVFLGGFSAATSMVLITSMTMATMISNHLLLPLVDWIPALGFIERHLLKSRWLAVTCFILMGYWFERLVGGEVMLVNIGIISFAAVLQFAPAIVGGIFWRQANSRGAVLGLSAGSLVWAYTMLLPALVTGGWFSPHLIEHGPLGIDFLRPERLFGVRGMDPVSHSVFWSLLANVVAYILGSLARRPDQQAQRDAESFVHALTDEGRLTRGVRHEAYISLAEKRRRIESLLLRYFEPAGAAAITEKSLHETQLVGRERISITELADLYNEVEKNLAGVVGTAGAHRALMSAGVFTPREAQELSEVYGEILAGLRARPEDLKRRINYLQERQQLTNLHAEELEEKVVELQNQILRRKMAEQQVRESEERYRTAIEYSNDGVVLIKDNILWYVNRKFAEMFGYDSRREIVGRSLGTIVHPEDRERVVAISAGRRQGQVVPSRYDFKGLRKDGSSLFIAVSATIVSYKGRTVNLAYLRDVTDRRRHEDEIRQLSRRLIQGAEDERKRLAADLHDEFGQSLTALHLGVRSLESSLPTELALQQARCEQLILRIEDLAENVRKISSDLRPDMLDHLGLIPTLEWYAEELRQRATGLEVEFKAVGFKRRLDPKVEIVLYRIMQEALNNVVKHAGAGKVSIRLTYSHPTAIMVISDDGRGMDISKDAPAREPSSGIGLISMRERVASVGGTIDIRSEPGKGTTIRVALPDQPPPNAEPLLEAEA